MTSLRPCVLHRMAASAILTFFTVTSVVAESSIVWSGIQDIVIGLGPGLSSTYLDLNDDGIDNFVFINNESTLSLGPISNSAAIADPTWQLGKTRYRPLEETMLIGMELDSPYEWNQSEDMILSYMMHIPTGEVIGGGPWHTVTNGLLGISFEIDGNTHYGWMRMSDISFSTFRVHDWAYETQPHVGIVAHVTRDLSFVSIAQASDGTLSLSLQGPPMQTVLMECSYDLVAWAPLKWQEDEKGNVTVELHQIDASGHLHIEAESVGRKQRFYRAALLP